MKRRSEQESDEYSAYYEKNGAFRWMVGQGRWGWLRFVLVMLPLAGGVALVCWWRDALNLKGIYSNQEAKGLLEDYVMLAILLTLPIAVVLLRNLFSKLEGLFSVLPEMIVGESATLESEIAEIRDFVQLRTATGKRCYYGVLGFMTVLMVVFQLVMPLVGAATSNPTWSIWPSKFPVVFGFAVLWALWWSVLVLGALLWYTVAIAIRVFPMIFRYATAGALRVVPVSPDGQGGMAAIGSLAYALTLMPGCGVLVVVTWYFMQGADALGIAGSVLYFIVLTALFFVPLWSVHDAMRKGKEKELNRLARMYRAAYERLPTGEGECEEPAKARENVAYLSQLDHLYQRAESMPVWPFDPRTIWQFVSLVFGPAAVLVVEKVAQTPLSDLVEEWLK